LWPFKVKYPFTIPLFATVKLVPLPFKVVSPVTIKVPPIFSFSETLELPETVSFPPTNKFFVIVAFVNS